MRYPHRRRLPAPETNRLTARPGDSPEQREGSTGRLLANGGPSIAGELHPGREARGRLAAIEEVLTWSTATARSVSRSLQSVPQPALLGRQRMDGAAPRFKPGPTRRPPSAGRLEPRPERQRPGRALLGRTGVDGSLSSPEEGPWQVDSCRGGDGGHRCRHHHCGARYQRRVQSSYPVDVHHHHACNNGPYPADHDRDPSNADDPDDFLLGDNVSQPGP
jgi:hypothetical protein